MNVGRAKELIELDRLNIEDTPDEFRVTYGDVVYAMPKKPEADSTPRDEYHEARLFTEVGIVPQLRQVLIQEQSSDRVEQLKYEEVPDEFIEAVLFHQLREMEYENAGFENAFERATNDEVLYAIKFFSAEKRDRFIAFACEYRAPIEINCIETPWYAGFSEDCICHPDNWKYFQPPEKEIYLFITTDDSLASRIADRINIWSYGRRKIAKEEDRESGDDLFEEGPKGRDPIMYKMRLHKGSEFDETAGNKNVIIASKDQRLINMLRGKAKKVVPLGATTSDDDFESLVLEALKDWKGYEHITGHRGPYNLLEVI